METKIIFETPNYKVRVGRFKKILEAQQELEKVTLLVDEATTKKEKIEAAIELRKAKARLQAVA